MRGLLPLTILLSLAACGGSSYKAPVNTPPTANAGPAQTVDAGTVVTLAGSGSDAEQDPLSYLWTLTKPATSVTSLENYHVATPTFTADVAGTYVATLTTNDGKVDSTPSSVTITAQVPVQSFVNLWNDASCTSVRKVAIIDQHLVYTESHDPQCISSDNYKLYESSPAKPLCSVGSLVLTAPCTDTDYTAMMQTIVANHTQADLGLGSAHQVQVVYTLGQ